MSDSIWPVLMRGEETKHGYRVIRPGEAPWLPAEDWDQDCVVTQAGREVRLVLIVAKELGQGAFTRMVERIQANGLTPVVLAPHGRFRAHLERLGWQVTLHGHGFLREEQWRP